MSKHRLSVQIRGQKPIESAVYYSSDEQITVNGKFFNVHEPEHSATDDPDVYLTRGPV